MTDDIVPHQHDWLFYQPTRDAKPEILANSSCRICGLTPEAVANAAAIRTLLDERAALVEIARAVATADTLAYESDAGDDQRCVFCYGVKNEHGISEYQHVSDYHEWQHANDCPVTKARALLGLETSQP